MIRWILTAALSLSALWAQAAPIAVLISADSEWRETRAFYTPRKVERSPYGEFFFQAVGGERVLFFQGGWGKVAAAGSTQYVIDRWRPRLLVNLGTCGGIRGRIERFAVLLAERTTIYDIYEQMGSSQEALDHYSVRLDHEWLGSALPAGVKPARLVSADRDLMPADIARISKEFDAAAADWESGAIAWVASRNGTRIVILRGVSDLVGAEGGEAYGKLEVFAGGTAVVMKKLFGLLPRIVARAAR